MFREKSVWKIRIATFFFVKTESQNESGCSESMSFWNFQLCSPLLSLCSPEEPWTGFCMLTGSICSCSVKEIHLYLSLSLCSCILSQLRLRNSGTCWRIWLPPRVPAADLANLPSSSVTLIVEEKKICSLVISLGPHHVFFLSHHTCWPFPDRWS